MYDSAASTGGPTNTRRQSLRTSLLSVAGVLLAFAAAVNAFINVPHLREDMIEIQVRPTLLQAISLGLYFGAFAMAGLALVVLAAAVESARTGSGNRTLLAIVSAVFLAFGATAIVSGDASPHMLGYAAAGALVAVAAALSGPAREGGTVAGR